MYLIKTPVFIQNLFPNFTWKIPTQEKVIYLTFDDGPIPEITPWVLDQLAKYNAKATFFCVGENVEKYPYLFHRVKNAGHAIGNHTHNHMSGWASDISDYVRNVDKCARLVKSRLFRPPYGRLKPAQAKLLSDDYRIVMWDVLSGDFDSTISPENCAQNVIDNATDGSIIVFHDNMKAKENLYHALPKVLDHFSRLGYRFGNLKDKKQELEELRSA